MTRPNKLEGLHLVTLSCRVLEFEGKVRANPLEDLSDASFLSKLLVLPGNVRLDRKKVFARYKHSSLFGLIISNEEKKLYNIDTRWSSLDGVRRQRHHDVAVERAPDGNVVKLCVFVNRPSG